MLSNNFLSHITELRKRLLRCVAAVSILFIILYYFNKSIFAFFAKPLTAQLLHDSSLIAIDITAPLFIPLKLCLFLAFFITVPYLFHQLWAFIAPGLYHRERHIVWLLLCSSTLLFYLGVTFTYWVVFPLLFTFFTQVAPVQVKVMPDINHYLSLSMHLFMVFGLAFEVPVFIWLLVKSNLCSIKTLRHIRPYIIVGAFTVGMLLTPPDVLSQVLLAIPIYFLYEVGLFACRVSCKPTATTPVSDNS